MEEFEDGLETGVSSSVTPVLMGECLGGRLPTLISSFFSTDDVLEMDRPSPCEALRVGMAGGRSRSTGDDSKENVDLEGEVLSERPFCFECNKRVRISSATCDLSA